MATRESRASKLPSPPAAEQRRKARRYSMLAMLRKRYYECSNLIQSNYRALPPGASNDAGPAI